MPKNPSMTLPATMRVVEITQIGGPEVLKAGTRPLQLPSMGEVLIKVAAAGVNRADTMQRTGKYPMPPGAPDIMGLEVSGTIVALGLGVTEWQLGDEVCALVAGGGYADYCVAPAQNCMTIPKGVSLMDGAALPETFMTVWSNVWDRAQLSPGETLLVQGGSSGIGVTAIQMAHALGNTVYVTAGSAAKCTACEALGADRAINYRTEDFVAVIKELTAGKGVDVILDMVGGSYVERELKSLATDGRLVFISAQGGPKGEINVNAFITGRLTVTGSALRPRTVEFKAQIARNLRHRIWPLIEAGKIKPVIYKAFPLDEAAAAHTLLESSEHIGKILLVP